MLRSLDAIHLVSAFLLDAAVVLESGPFEGGGDFNVVKCLSQECRSWGRVQPHLSVRPGCRLPFGEVRGVTGPLRAVVPAVTVPAVVIPAVMGLIPGPPIAPAARVAPVVEVIAEIPAERGEVACGGLSLLRGWGQCGG